MNIDTFQVFVVGLDVLGDCLPGRSAPGFEGGDGFGDHLFVGFFVGGRHGYCLWETFF